MGFRAWIKIPKLCFEVTNFAMTKKHFVTHSLKWSGWWFLLMIKTVLLRLTGCQMVQPWLLYYQNLFVWYCTYKFVNFSNKKLTVACQYCTIMCARMLRNQSVIYSFITRGKHFVIHLIAPIWVCLTSIFFQN